MKKQEELYSFPQQNDGVVVETDIRMIPLSELRDFNGHPLPIMDCWSIRDRSIS